MPVDGEALFKAAVMLAELEEMQVTVTNTLAASTAAAIAGTGGFLLMGPPGVLIGSSLAGLGAYCFTKNKFKPVFVILKEDLRPQQQQELLDLLRKTFENVDHTDFLKLYTLLMLKQEMWELMRTKIVTFITRHFMEALAVKNVNVETKLQTDLERYQKFTEEFKRRHGLSGAACPPAIASAGVGGTSGRAVGWRPDFAPGIGVGPQVAATGTTSTIHHAAPTSVQPVETISASFEASAPINDPACNRNSDDSQIFEEDELLPSAPKSAVKTTL